MTLIVETGAGLSDAESYCSVAFADQYHGDRGNTSWFSGCDREAALRKATDFMMQRYGQKWLGYRRYSTQALDWPRVSIVVDKYIVVEPDIVPLDIQKVCAELAYRSLTSSLDADLSQGVTRTKVGPIEVEYDRNSSQKVIYGSVENTLSKYLTSTGATTARLVRV